MATERPMETQLALDECHSLSVWLKEALGHDDGSPTLVSLEVIRKALECPSSEIAPKAGDTLLTQRLDEARKFLTRMAAQGWVCAPHLAAVEDAITLIKSEAPRSANRRPTPFLRLAMRLTVNAPKRCRPSRTP